MAYAQAGLSGPLQYGDNKKLYYYNSTADSVSVIAASGYMNNADDDLGIDTGDQMVVKDSANDVATLECVTSTGGALLWFVLSGSGGVETSTGGALSVSGISFLNSTQAFTLHSAPIRAGQEKKIVALVAGPTVTTTGGADLVGERSTAVLRFASAFGAVELTAFSSTSWVITGSPLFSVSTTGNAMVITS